MVSRGFDRADDTLATTLSKETMLTSLAWFLKLLICRIRKSL